MYLHILKKDLRRKKTMNAILLVFIALAATFIASSAGNLIAISTALDLSLIHIFTDDPKKPEAFFECC